MLSFAGVTDDEGDASRLRLSEGLCLECSIIHTRKAATSQGILMKIAEDLEQNLFRSRLEGTPAYGA